MNSLRYISKKFELPKSVPSSRKFEFVPNNVNVSKISLRESFTYRFVNQKTIRRVTFDPWMQAIRRPHEFQLNPFILLGFSFFGLFGSSKTEEEAKKEEEKKQEMKEKEEASAQGKLLT
jgi:hypothetical protein